MKIIIVDEHLGQQQSSLVIVTSIGMFELMRASAQMDLQLTHYPRAKKEIL